MSNVFFVACLIVFFFGICFIDAVSRCGIAAAKTRCASSAFFKSAFIFLSVANCSFLFCVIIFDGWRSRRRRGWCGESSALRSRNNTHLKQDYSNTLRQRQREREVVRQRYFSNNNNYYRVLRLSAGRHAKSNEHLHTHFLFFQEQ